MQKVSFKIVFSVLLLIAMSMFLLGKAGAIGEPCKTRSDCKIVPCLGEQALCLGGQCRCPLP
ncbi:hypothetical protein SLEP1_g479 [Rubroshorea leprosula]|uniref:Late nodulin n=1 Tax=Rubroshorea leprosula TaxID=152421 RepID=A0AAV5HK13_9ROSI|nr:hypothetical protein SLEP1_g479 [Rubroshorea leprosula]